MAVNPAAIEARINTLLDELDAAHADVELLRRLKDAEANSKKLSADLTQARKELADALAEIAKAKADARFANFRDITVTEIRGDKGSNVLGYAYTITVTKAANHGQGEFEQVLTFPGFKAIPEDALSYLIERHPERIPVAIRELGEDVYEAFDTYFAGMRRGFINKAVA